MTKPRLILPGLYPLIQLDTLTREEETDLLALAVQGDIGARNRIIEANMRFAILVAGRFHRVHKIQHIDRNDLVQACVLGMIRAVSKWDPVKSHGRFIGYAKHWMRAFMQSEMEDSKMYKVPPTMVRLCKLGLIKNEATANAVRDFQHMKLHGEWPEPLHPVYFLEIFTEE